jgi:hypothetical protein
VQNKVIEATAAGLPNVVTPQVFDGLPDGVRPACVSATDARPFADAILALLRSRPEERRRIALQADLSKMTWDARLQPLVGLFERM